MQTQSCVESRVMRTVWSWQLLTGIFPFVRRQNLDSSVDSICAACYQTIASADLTTEVELASAEQNHLCSPHSEFNHPHWEEHRHIA
jgi:hypothetical protein